MQRSFALTPVTKMLILACFVVLLAPFSTAQYKEVEIEIAGPWDYVPDTNSPNNIIVFSPNLEHTMIVFPGGDADAVDDGLPAGALLPESGIHSLILAGFDPTKCPTSPPPSADSQACCGARAGQHNI